MMKGTSMGPYLAVLTAFLIVLTIGNWALVIISFVGLFLFFGFYALIFIALLLIPQVLWIGYISLLLGLKWPELNQRKLSALSHRAFYALQPLIYLFRYPLGLSLLTVRRSNIAFLSRLTLAAKGKYEGRDILLLTPHCLQRQRCPIKLTTDVELCQQCGACRIGDLLALSHRYGCHFAVANGGTLARKIVQQTKPKVIIAVACERDLLSGMADVFPLPVIGLLNDRPEGPCVNTLVNSALVEEAIIRLIKHGE